MPFGPLLIGLALVLALIVTYVTWVLYLTDYGYYLRFDVWPVVH